MARSTSAVSQKVYPDSYTYPEPTIKCGSITRRRDWKQEHNLQAYSVRANRTVADKKIHTTVSDGVESPVTENPCLGGRVRRLGTGNSCFVGRDCFGAASMDTHSLLSPSLQVAATVLPIQRLTSHGGDLLRSKFEMGMGPRNRQLANGRVDALKSKQSRCCGRSSSQNESAEATRRARR